MRTLYIECKMGASGNMLTGALLDLLPEPERYVQQLNALGIPHAETCMEQVTRCGISGKLATVLVHGHEEEEHHHHHHHHHHSSLGEIAHIIEGLPLPEQVKANALEAFRRIGQAESQVHGVPMTDIHFHEVGSLDAAADVVNTCLLLAALQVEQVIVSPIHVGSGTVHCAHGVLPVPAPATERLLRGVPYYSGSIECELCTPTGAALLTTLADSFGPMPQMTVEATGYGFGTKELPQANCLRIFLGETAEKSDSVYEIRCNLDDMTGEELGLLREKLEASQALDVTMIPVQMKKGRPGILLECLCRPEDRERLCTLILRHSSTAGVRYSLWDREILNVSFTERETPWGTVREKQYSGFGIKKTKPEYEDLAAISRQTDLPVAKIKESL